MSDPQQPGEGAQSPQDPTASPSSASDHDAPPAYVPPTYVPGQPSGAGAAPSSGPQPPAGSAPEAPGASGGTPQPGQAPGSGGYATPGGYGTAGGYPGAGQAGGTGQPYGAQPGATYGAPASSPYGGAPDAGSPSGGSSYGGSPYGGPARPAKAGAGLAIAGVAVGGAALLFSWVPGLGLLLALVGLAFGIVTLVRKGGSKLLGWIGTGLSALAALIAVAVLLFTVVLANAIDQQVGEGSPASTAPATPLDDEGDDAAAGQDPSGASNAAFGETVTYDDGLAVTVSAPEAYTPGEYAVGADQAANVVFTITIANGTAENYDPSFVFPSVSSGGVEASDIYDSDTLDSPRTAVPAGQSVSWQAAFSVADPESIVFQLSPDSFDYDDVVYQN